jgi:hypothetical protein
MGRATICHRTPDDIEWYIEARVIFGTAGSYWEPPESDEVEFLDVFEDLGHRLGPQPKLSFEDFVERYRLSDEAVQALENKAVNAAYDNEADDYGEE